MPTKASAGHAAHSAPARPNATPYATFAASVTPMPEPSSHHASFGASSLCLAASSTTMLAATMMPSITTG